jgi:sugar lactone lactonase YvrE
MLHASIIWDLSTQGGLQVKQLIVPFANIGWRWCASRVASYRRPLSILLTALAVISSGSNLYSQKSFGSQAVGLSTSPQAVIVTSQAAGTVSSVQVLALGAPGLDFVDAGGNCLNGSFGAAGQVCTELISFTPKYPGVRSGAVVLLDSQDNVLGTTFVSGVGQAGLGVFTNYRNMRAVAGIQGIYGQSGDGNRANQANLYLPSTVAVDGRGNLYIADSAHHRIRKVDAGTQVITTVAGNGSPGYSGDGSPALNARLTDPEGVTVDGAGNLYIADTGNNVIREVLAGSGIILTIAGNGTLGDAGDGGPALAAELNQPVGVSVDLNGALYIADTANNRIKMVFPVGGMITSASLIRTMAGNGKAGYGGDGGAAASAELNLPFTVAFDASGNMYIPDSGNNCVRVVRSGVISTFAGMGPLNSGYTGDGGNAAAAQLWAPTGVALDVAQNVYIADTQNNAIRRVNSHTSVISTVVRNGNGSDYYDNTLFRNTLYAPTGLAVDGMGNLYIADRLDMMVKELHANQAAISFVTTRQDSASAPVRVYIENDGNAPLTIDAAVAGVNASMDSATTTCVPGSVNVWKSCSIGAVFAPTAAGNPVAGLVQVALQSVNSPMLINVVGNATPVSSTQVTLLASQNPINAGLDLTLTAMVTTGDTKPLDGSVTFNDEKITIGKVPVDRTGVARLKVSNLNIGSHSISASYAGDTNGHSDSPPASITQVVDELTATSLTSSSGGQSVVGSSITLTATISIQGSGNLTPDGAILFIDGSIPLATVEVNPGTPTTYTTNRLQNGPHSLMAAYSGNAAKYIVGSDSPVLTVNIVAPTSILLNSSATRSSYGTPVTFTATMSSTGGTVPSGGVRFLDNGNEMGAGSPTSNAGVLAFTTSSLTVGTHTITATFAGDSYNQSATSQPIIETISLAQTGTTLSVKPNPGIAGQPATLAATVTSQSGSAIESGLVTFNDGKISIGTAKLGPAGIASILVALPPGTHVLGAVYSGDSNNDTSTSSSVSYGVDRATTSVTLKSDHSTGVVLSPITFTVAVSGNGGIPTGPVEFKVDGVPIGSSVLDSTGSAALTNSQISVGTHVVTASYGGDQNDSGSDSIPLSQIVQAISTTTDLTSYQTAGNDAKVMLIATAIGSGPTPTGIITFNSGNAALGTSTLDAGGVATFVPVLGPGTSTITASYGGDAIHAGSTSSPIQVINNLQSVQNFIVALKPPSATISTTQNVKVIVSLTSQNGFQDTLGMGCMSLPAPLTCHFSSTSVAVKSKETQNVELIIDTNKPLSGGQSARNLSSGFRFELAGVGLPAGLLLGVCLWRSKKRSPVLVAFLASLLAGVVFLDGCGGSITETSAKPGTYTFQVGAVGQSTRSQQYETFTLTVTH